MDHHTWCHQLNRVLTAKLTWGKVATLSLGNDFNKSVRTAMSAKGDGPWPVIERLLSNAAVANGWVSSSSGAGGSGFVSRAAAGSASGSGEQVGGQLRATQKLFTSMSLGGVKHWEEYTAAR